MDLKNIVWLIALVTCSILSYYTGRIKAHEEVVEKTVNNIKEVRLTLRNCEKYLAENIELRRRDDRCLKWKEEYR